jgi:SAM-dependent methyltransferase
MEQENSYVISTESAAEMARLINQDLEITKAMGGLFPHNLPLSGVTDVLDVACGPGGWAQEVAFQHPEMEVTGVDISKTMTQYAKTNAQLQKLENLDFVIMDVTKPLPFSDTCFDLVNARFMAGFLHKEKWPLVVKEFVRIVRPGGFIVLTECDRVGQTNSEAYERYASLGWKAMTKAGLAQHPLGTDLGIVALLERYLLNAGCEDICQIPHILNFSAGHPANPIIYEDIKVGFKLAQPFLLKMGGTTQEELDDLYNRALIDMLSDSFAAVWILVTTWGRKPANT